VQIVTGYGEAGNALVTGGVDKLIFVGSTKAGSCGSWAVLQSTSGPLAM
jgi:acyl-CoA reductase-like NAD-dependent aldehyde dehydrogenase